MIVAPPRPTRLLSTSSTRSAPARAAAIGGVHAGAAGADDQDVGFQMRHAAGRVPEARIAAIGTA